MEDLLEVYHRPYNKNRPVICMDESNKQLVSEVKSPIPCEPGKPLRVDDEYIRNGVADVFMAVEPLKGLRYVSITKTRKKVDWAHFIRELLDEKYPKAQKVILIMDNLNTHGIASLYDTFSPEEAFRLAQKLELHFTPVHGSWLNVAEVELSVLVSQCLDRRIPDIETMTSEVIAWQNDRNNRLAKINWHFTTSDARIKLRRLYPSF
jgi:hypothetical protein